MDFTILQFFQLLHRQMGNWIVGGGDRQRDQDFISVQPWIVVAEVLYLQLLNRFDNVG